ncbi:MAG: ribosomal protein S18-alanine N-acetyltransferase [Acidobacteriia bacterium]|nr:ribosomal protein S18-alanine N-acetyltransferase [Terriglobia bacterium]
MIRVRVATPDDVPAMLAVEHHAATAAHWNEREYRKALEPGTPEREVLVIEEGALLGFIVARVLGDEWEIENVAVSGPARRRGLGSRLVGELLDRARARRARSVFLEVRESNQAARLLYEKWAFLPAGRRKAYYSDPVEDALLFRFSFPLSLSKAVEGL